MLRLELAEARRAWLESFQDERQRDELAQSDPPPRCPAAFVPVLRFLFGDDESTGWRYRQFGELPALATAAGGVASDLEDHAAAGNLGQAPALVEQLETMAKELMHLTSGLLFHTLRQAKANIRETDWAEGMASSR